MDEDYRRFFFEAEYQRELARRQIDKNKANEAIQAVKRRQELESIGRWVINKCLIRGLLSK
jgi:hypothetical protein